MANKPTPSRLAAQYQTYPTASEAAVAALRGITDKNNEFGGGVLYNKDQDVYAATEPTGQSDGSHFSASVGVPKGWQLQSTYHTHPSGADSTKFSADDINTAKQLKAPSYVLARDDNKVRMFDPSGSKVLTDSGAGRQPYSFGSVVNETPPTPPPASSTPAAALAAADTPAAPAATTTPVTGSRIMKDFAARHRAKTTKYKHRVIHIRTK